MRKAQITRIATKTVRISIVLFSIVFFSLPGFGDEEQPNLDVPFEGTHPDVVRTMLDLAEVDSSDTIYDLGCGDGRIVIMAARKYGVRRGIGFDIDPQRLKEANFLKKAYGLSDGISFVNKDIFVADFSDATVITLYLLDWLNLQLRPRLLMELRPGTRIVSHAFDMSDWDPDRLLEHKKARKNRVMKWVIPAAVGGTWRWESKIGKQLLKNTLQLKQKFQFVNGFLIDSSGNKTFEIENTKLNGSRILFSADSSVGGRSIPVEYRGEIDGDMIKGTQVWKIKPFAGTYPWTAKRAAVDISGLWAFDVDAEKHDLNGVLTVSRDKGKKWSAFYSLNSDGSSKSIEHIYVWGTSIYFRLPYRSKKEFIVFSGSLNEKKGSGIATLPKDSFFWAAKRPN